MKIDKIGRAVPVEPCVVVSKQLHLHFRIITLCSVR